MSFSSAIHEGRGWSRSSRKRYFRPSMVEHNGQPCWTNQAISYPGTQVQYRRSGLVVLDNLLRLSLASLVEIVVDSLGTCGHSGTWGLGPWGQERQERDQRDQPISRRER